ncbi:MAG: glycyl-radical enzyme activating protein [Candidatus Heimdallarchaeota archaeon]
MVLKNKGIIFDVKRYALHDGTGIRTTVFFKGCPLSCWWCHNPEGQKIEVESYHKQSGHTKRLEEPIGRKMTVGEVITDIEKDTIFYDESGGGVTFSGGEPLLQFEFLDKLLDACLEREISTTLDTSGYAPWNVITRIKDKIDLFLYDLKLLDDENHQKYTGVSNKLVLSNLKKLDGEGKNIILRFPIIPNITNTKTEINLIASYIKELQTTKEIDLLPYHSFQTAKYERLRRPYKLAALSPPTNERLEQLKAFFSKLGFTVRIGG